MQFASIGDDDLRNPLSVHFVGEVGRDDGGVTRDWYSVLSKEIFNPQYALFTHSAADDYTFQINPNSDVNPDHLDFFRFIGAIVGKALLDGCLLDAHFTRLVYKRILDKPVNYHDMASVDVQFYRSLCWVCNSVTSPLIFAQSHARDLLRLEPAEQILKHFHLYIQSICSKNTWYEKKR